MAPERRAGRARGKSDPIDALAVARAALREPALSRVARWLARRPQEVQVRVARDLVTRCRALTRAILELDQELQQRTAETAPALLEQPACGA
jgi:transposase